MKTLYKQHKNGKIGTFNIYAEGNTIVMESRQSATGKVTTQTEVVEYGKGNRTLAEQIESRIESRIQAKLDIGFKTTELEAREMPGTNALSLPIPMLAGTNTKKLGDNVYVQPKLDGMRMIVHKNGSGNLIAYSREGKELANVDHILEDADFLLNKYEFLDGELYAHGVPLNKIMSWTKRRQENTANIKFHIFDMIDDIPFSDRLDTLTERVTEFLPTLQGVSLVETQRVTPKFELPTALATARQHGYEGLILRDGDKPYEIDTRSTGLIKVKQFADAEYPVIDVTTGARGMAVLVCQTPSGREFRVTAPGTHAEKRFALHNPDFFIGQQVTIQYAGLTSYGVPFHPVCLGIKK